jgi:hypothetical protein
MTIKYGTEKSNNITREMRHLRIESWLDGHIESRAILHHINFVWGKKQNQ